jgi:hypothetical protein
MARMPSIVLLSCVAAWAEHNLTGTWRLDKARSDYGAVPLPDKLVTKIEHKDGVLRVNTEQSGGMAPGKTEYRYTTDGKDCVNRIRSNELHSTARWEGDVLKFSHTLNFQGQETVRMDDEWTLSPDGGTLTQLRRVKAAQGSMETRAVLSRQ